MFKQIFSLSLIFFFSLSLSAQTKIVEGYVFETGNRGYLNVVKVDLISTNDQLLESTMTNKDGFFSFSVDASKNYKIGISKDMFEEQETLLDMSEHDGKDKVFVSLKMKRKPGYQFEITLAPKREDENIAVDAIRGALIEVYNNTTKEEVIVLKDHPNPDFSVNLIKGNHYTILVRKKDYMAKRMEAFVDVEGCILCFEGVGKVEPGVSDNLTEGNSMGVLLANVEMEKINMGKKIEVQDIYYDFGSAKLRTSSKRELDKVVTLINDNPALNIELGSHTDSRGGSRENQSLSVKRAKAAVAYLIDEGGIHPSNIVARGYGETEIKNGCVNGVECTEAKHQVNRRTELKITGLKSAPPPIKSLKKMKEEEDMEALIVELQNQEQVKITGDQTIEDVIGKTEGSSKGNADSNKKKEKPSKEEVEKAIESVEIEEPNKQVVDELMEAGAKKMEAEKNQLNGYKILILESDEFLKPSHEIFTKHQQIFQHLEGDKILYLIGDFNEFNKAEGFLSTVKMMYPEAKIVNFKGGEILN